MKVYTEEEIASRLRHLHKDWDISEGKLRRTFIFEDFKQAFAFMTWVSMLAEERNHHPDWTNVYNRVHIRFVTHVIEKLTNRDFDFAEILDSASH